MSSNWCSFLHQHLDHCSFLQYISHFTYCIIYLESLICIFNFFLILKVMVLNIWSLFIMLFYYCLLTLSCWILLDLFLSMDSIALLGGIIFPTSLLTWWFFNSLLNMLNFTFWSPGFFCIPLNIVGLCSGMQLSNFKLAGCFIDLVLNSVRVFSEQG